MKNKLTISLLLFGLVAVSISCSKEFPTHVTPEATYKFSPDVLAYSNVAQGKYFIYKDSATGVTDSIIASRSEVVLEHATNGWTGWNRQVYYLTLSKPYAGTNMEWLALKATAYTGFYSTASSDSCMMELYDVHSFQQDCLVLKRVPNEAPGTSVTVEGITYNDVMITYDAADNRAITYWAKGIGIIQRSILVNGVVVKTYMLVRHN